MTLHWKLQVVTTGQPGKSVRLQPWNGKKSKNESKQPLKAARCHGERKSDNAGPFRIHLTYPGGRGAVLEDSCPSLT